MSRAKNLTGQRFERLTVVKRLGYRPQRHATMYLCRCDCGKETIVTSVALITGNTKSCGCLQPEIVGKLNKHHGSSKTRLYRIWAGMKDRCYRPKHVHYKHYGGRGITICDEWLHDFTAFRDWALKTGYDESAPRGVCTIDRIDNDKGYSPDNCRWVTMKEQRHNQRDSK